MRLLKKPLFYIRMSCILISGCSLLTKSTSTPQPKSENNIENEGNKLQENTETEIKKENQNEETYEFIEYENKKYKFKIQIPDNRTFQEDKQGFQLLLNTPQNDEINENLGITIQELQSEESLESFTEKTIEGLKDLYENYKEIEKKNIEINGIKGVSSIYEVSENGYEIKAQQTVFLKDNKSYIFQYTATKDTYNNYINEINNIINSFTILN